MKGLDCCNQPNYLIQIRLKDKSSISGTLLVCLEASRRPAAKCARIGLREVEADPY